MNAGNKEKRGINDAKSKWMHEEMKPEQIDKITTAQIKAAFQRKLQPERMVTVVLGGV